MLHAFLLSQNLLVEADVLGNDEIGAKAFLCGLAGGFAHGLESRRIIDEAQRAGGHGFDIADGEQQAGDAVVDEFWDAADSGGDGRYLAGHSFESGKTKGLKFAGHHEEICQSEQFADALLLAEEVNARLDAEIVSKPLGGGAVGAVADENELRGPLAGDKREYLNHIRDALDRPEVRKVNEERLIGRGIMGAAADTRSFVVDGRVYVAVEKLVMVSMGRVMLKSTIVLSRR